MKRIADFLRMKIEARSQLNLRYRQPTKPPPRGKHWSNLWTCYSPKISRNVHFYSDIEYFHWVTVVEARPDILGFCEQPLYMTGTYQGKEGKSLIDMWLLFTSGLEEYRELKSAREMENIDNNEELKRQITIQRSWCSNTKSNYKTVLDTELFPNELLFDNWSKILLEISHTRGIDLAKEMGEILLFVLNNEAETIANIWTHTKIDSINLIPSLCRLLHLGLLGFQDNDKAFAMDSKIMIPKEIVEEI